MFVMKSNNLSASNVICNSVLDTDTLALTDFDELLLRENDIVLSFTVYEPLTVLLPTVSVKAEVPSNVSLTLPSEKPTFSK